MSANTSVQTAARSTDVVIGENVHQLMWRARETQTSLASILGITQSALSHKLRGSRPWFSAEISMVAGRYGVGIGDLFIEGGPAGGWGLVANTRTPD